MSDPEGLRLGIQLLAGDNAPPKSPCPPWTGGEGTSYKISKRYLNTKFKFPFEKLHFVTLILWRHPTYPWGEDVMEGTECFAVPITCTQLLFFSHIEVMNRVKQLVGEKQFERKVHPHSSSGAVSICTSRSSRRPFFGCCSMSTLQPHDRFHIRYRPVTTHFEACQVHY